MKLNIFLSALLIFLYLSCSHNEEENFFCQKSSSEISDNTNFTLLGCNPLLNEVKIEISNLSVSSGGNFTVYAYADNAASGLAVSFTHNRIDILRDGNSVANNTSVNSENANTYCLEIHDVTRETHVQVFQGGCSSTLLFEFNAGIAFSPSTKNLGYKRSGGVSFLQLTASAEAGHDH